MREKIGKGIETRNVKSKRYSVFFFEYSRDITLD
jgi:hypothetical protein